MNSNRIEYKSVGWKLRFFLIMVFGLSIVLSSNAHEIRPAYLQIQELAPGEYEVLWKIPTLQNRAPNIQPVFPPGFDLKETNREILPDAQIIRYQARYPSALNGKEIHVEGLALTLIDVLLQIELLSELSYTLLLQPNAPKVRIPVAPGKWPVIKLYLKLGIEHILLGIDHLLFVMGLLLLVSQFKSLIQTITAFTLAHSITLALATLDLVKLPPAPVEAVIALSILFLANEYIRHKNGESSFTAQYPWVVAFSFGLLHGFGFAGALTEIGLPQREIPLALFTFNVGVELGQVLFIFILIGLQYALRNTPLTFPSWTWKLIPYSIGSIAAFWLIERVLGFV